MSQEESGVAAETAAADASTTTETYVVIRESDAMPVAKTGTREAADAILGDNSGWVVGGPEGLKALAVNVLRKIFEHLSEKKLARRFDAREEGVARTWAMLMNAGLPSELPNDQFGVYKAATVVIKEDASLIKTPFEGQTKEEEKMAATAKKSKATKSVKGTKRGASKSKGTSERKPGSGALIKEMIRKRATTEEILKAVKKAFPDSKAKASDVSWNRSDMRKKGEKVPDPKE